MRECTPTPPVTDTNTSEKLPVDQVRINPEKPYDNSKKQKSTRKKKGEKDSGETTEKKTQMGMNSTIIPLNDFEKPLKTLEDNVIDLKNKSCRHELMLNEVIGANTSTTSCGLTKIEVSELQDKVNKIEKDNATLLKTLEIHRVALSHVSDLQNEINDLKGELKDVIASNRDLALANIKLGNELVTLRQLTLGNNNSPPSSSVDPKEEKTSKKKKPKLHSKKTQTEPHSAAGFGEENHTTECGTQCDSSSIPLPTMPHLYTEALASNSMLPGNNAKQDTRPPKQAPLSKEPNQAPVLKEPKTWSTVPSDPHQATGLTPSPNLDKPYIVGGGQREHENASLPLVDGADKASNQKRRCLLIHDDYHDDFDRSKFTNRYEINLYKMSAISTIRQNITKVIEKILDEKSDLIIVHAGHKDLWNGHKSRDLIDDLSHIIDELLQLTKATICISLIIPGDGQYPKLEQEVETVNRAVGKYISNIRKDKKLSYRIFTTNNDRLKEFMSKHVGPNGTQLRLSTRGKKMLWLRLRDSMARSLKPVEYQRHNSEGGTEARETYRRKTWEDKGNHRNYSDNVARRH